MNSNEADKKIMIKNYRIEMGNNADVRSVAICDQKIVILTTKNALYVYSYDIKLIDHIPLKEPSFQGKGFILGEEDKKALLFVDTETYKEILVYNLKTMQIVKIIKIDHIQDVMLKDSLLYVLTKDKLSVFTVSTAKQGNLIGVLQLMIVDLFGRISLNKGLKSSDRQNWLIETDKYLYLALLYKKAETGNFFRILCLKKSHPSKGFKDVCFFKTKHQTKQFIILQERTSLESDFILCFLNQNNKVIFTDLSNGKEIPYLIQKFNTYTPIYMNFVEKGKYLQLIQENEIVTLDIYNDFKQVAFRMKEISNTDWVFKRELLHFQKDKLILAQKDSLNIMWYE